MKLSLIFFSLCLAAAVVPLRSVPTQSSPALKNFPGWAQAPVPVGAQPVSLGDKQARLAADFPGFVAAFNYEDRLYIVRWIAQPTRRLHPVSDCLRALGNHITPAPLWADRDGTVWGACLAERDHEHLVVHERIFDQTGHSWTDVSTWYWHAMLGRTQGPWWAVTVLSPKA